MSQDKIVIINGRKYDAKTGLPLADSGDGSGGKKAASSSLIHSSLQRSKTLARRVTKKPERPAKPQPSKRAGRVMDIAKSSNISRFTPQKITKPTPKKTPKDDISVQRHPIVDKAVSNISSAVKPIQKTARDIKSEAISSALAQNSIKTIKKSFFGRHTKSLTIIIVSVVIAFLGAYLTYVNMPGLSVKFANLQANISATYPQYVPDGYSIDGPVSYSDGQVTIKFKANTGNTKFSLKQTKSSWDSTAVLDNTVRKAAGEQYLTNQEQGLTIYTYGGNGAWVNGGILYTIEGDAPLASEQITHIATSM